MKARTRRITTLLLLAALGLVAAGCARKSVEAPPASPPTPPVTTPDTTPVPKPTTPETPVPSGTGVTTADFQPAFFDFDSYALREDARAALDKDARLLRENTGVKVTVEGHCDERGTAEYNQALGEKRAQAARDYLVAAGIDTGRIQVVSYGKEQPFDLGHDEAAWAKNRRAHVVVR
jgi:peptidoglycan-associated lipoprotein